MICCAVCCGLAHVRRRQRFNLASQKLVEVTTSPLALEGQQPGALVVHGMHQLQGGRQFKKDLATSHLMSHQETEMSAQI